MSNSIYDGVYARWLKAPENFWAEVAEADSLVQKMGQGSRCLAVRRSIAGSPEAW